jgi:hypothetical protein
MSSKTEKFANFMVYTNYSMYTKFPHIPRVSYSGGGGVIPGMNLTWGDIPPITLGFFGNFFSGFENLITLKAWEPQQINFSAY